MFHTASVEIHSRASPIRERSPGFAGLPGVTFTDCLVAWAPPVEVVGLG